MSTRQKISYLFVVLLLVSLLGGCTPKEWEYAQKEYSQGNVYEAVKWSAKTLREKPNYKDAIVFLSNVLPSTYNNLYQEAKELSRNKLDIIGCSFQ